MERVYICRKIYDMGLLLLISSVALLVASIWNLNRIDKLHSQLLKKWSEYEIICPFCETDLTVNDGPQKCPKCNKKFAVQKDEYFPFVIVATWVIVGDGGFVVRQKDVSKINKNRDCTPETGGILSFYKN